ncbi:FKBP-type peptidyl-prolyl cis-trans isomerase [Gayadomonas joobiniege]|uniref:FKBP-type peptidyl-prolyl cis-trans isomerase n=1 Tax=Gayadomonas joobiniege TaxID=1234606 RepID=UPI0003632C4C|nr:FKBP-type peptidyl-prolyl cis-trans isomerase [Gayadomonas joobiniege]
MQKLGVMSALAAALVLAGCGQESQKPAEEVSATQQTQQEEAVKLQNLVEKQAYGLGVNFGSQLKSTIEQINAAGIALDSELVQQGVKDAMGGEPALEMAEIQSALQELQKEHQKLEAAKREAEGAEARQEGETFLAENAKKDGIQVTESGLQYEVITEGEGDKPAATDTVTVHYTGTLIDGTKFDSSVDRGEPAQFPLNRVIPGWTEGVQLMSPGAKYRFYIPYNLAYGEQGAGSIPPFATLVFDVELISIDESSEG